MAGGARRAGSPQCFQNDLVMSAANEYISSRPASISTTISTLWPPLQKAKLSVGPTAQRPGPMLPMVAADAVTEVTRSGVPIDSSTAPIAQVVR